MKRRACVLVAHGALVLVAGIAEAGSFLMDRVWYFQRNGWYSITHKVQASAIYYGTPDWDDTNGTVSEFEGDLLHRAIVFAVLSWGRELSVFRYVVMLPRCCCGTEFCI